MTAHDAGPWRGPTTEEWVERIARGSTPVREYVDGRFVSWIAPASRSGQNSDLARVSGEHGVAETTSARSETPVAPLPASPSRRGPVAAAG
jgi:hypothetical protein